MLSFRFKKLFLFLGAGLTLIVLISISLLAFEYIYGNADGVWYDIDIRRSTYRITTAFVLISVLIYCLVYGPEPLRNFLVSIGIFCFLLILLEGVSYLLFTANTSTPKPSTHPPLVRPDWTDSFVYDDILGVRAKKNWSLTWAPVKEGVVFDSITINTDEHSLRKTLNFTDPTGTTQHAFFFGGSFTYGDGVSDHETLPSQFQKYSPTYQAYNLGFLAYSPLHMLARLQHEDLTLLTTLQQGFAAYVYINDHIDRTIPATRWITMTRGKFPNLDKESITTHGVFSENRRLYSDFIQWFRTTYIHHVFRVDFPKKHRSEHFRLVVDVIKQSKQEYQKQFGNNNFYVIIFPGNPINPELRNMLQKNGLIVLDYSKLFDIDKYMLPFDPTHPNARAYKLVAARLAKDIAVLENDQSGVHWVGDK